MKKYTQNKDATEYVIKTFPLISKCLPYKNIGS